MRRLLLAAVAAVSLLAAARAHALQCAVVWPGWVRINHGVGMLYGRNFAARVSCSRGAPVLVYWRGGAMCPGRYFYGRSIAGRPFSCRVWSVWRR